MHQTHGLLPLQEVSLITPPGHPTQRFEGDAHFFGAWSISEAANSGVALARIDPDAETPVSLAVSIRHRDLLFILPMSGR
jgi:hypothetical protein